jgi:hypothetical protein
MCGSLFLRAYVDVYHNQKQRRMIIDSTHSQITYKIRFRETFKARYGKHHCEVGLVDDTMNSIENSCCHNSYYIFSSLFHQTFV